MPRVSAVDFPLAVPRGVAGNTLDGAYPNARGHAEIADTIWKGLTGK